MQRRITCTCNASIHGHEELLGKFQRDVKRLWSKTMMFCCQKHVKKDKNPERIEVESQHVRHRNRSTDSPPQPYLNWNVPHVKAHVRLSFAVHTHIESDEM